MGDEEVITIKLYEAGMSSQTFSNLLNAILLHNVNGTKLEKLDLQYFSFGGKAEYSADFSAVNYVYLDCRASENSLENSNDWLTFIGHII